MFQAYEHKPEYSAYPIKGVPPVSTAEGDAYLHAAVKWRDGTKQALAMLAVDHLVEPAVPVQDYIRIPVSEGVPYRNYIDVDVPAKLDVYDLYLLRTATNELGIDWRHMPRVGRPGSALITIDQGASAFEYSISHKTGRLTYPMVGNSTFMLAAVRALAMDRVMRYFAEQN